MRRIRYLFLLLAAWCGLALAGGSTINTTVPAPNSLISSAPIRANFEAAYSDINNLFGQNNGAVPPILPLLGQLWLNTSGTPYTLEEWDGNQWVVSAYMNASTHSWSTPPASLPLGTSINNPGTGTIETLLPVQSITQSSRIYSTGDFFKKTRRSNAGVAMSDTLPSATATGLTNGTQINIVNADASAIDTVTAGTGTTIGGNATFVIEPGRDMWWTYDAANTTWRPVANTGSSVLYAGAAPNASQIWGGSSVPGSASGVGVGACLGLSGGVLSDTCGGTATSVGLALPSVFSVTNSPITGAGVLTATLANEVSNAVWAGPVSGNAAAPSFRQLTGADLPAPAPSSLGGIESVAPVAHEWINSVGTSGAPALSQPGFPDLSGSAACTQLPALTGSIVTAAGSCATTIAPSGVAAASYASANITVGADGRITAASNGAGGGYPANYIVKTANYTTANGDNIMADTSGGAFTITLPASPSQFNQVCVSDASGSFGTNTLTIANNGNAIMGQSVNMTVTTPFASFCLIYYTSSAGWRIH